MLKKTGKSLLPFAVLLIAGILSIRSRRTTRRGGLKRIFVEGEKAVLARVREGRFARTLALVADLSGLPTGVEMMDYNHWSAFGMLGEILPWEDNTVSISATDRDQFGLPVAHVTFNLHDNDKKLIEHGKNVTMEMMRAAGAVEVVQENRFAHLVGGARMGRDPATSVVDAFGRTHDIANLFVCDGSVMPTQGSANPGLTIQALAARTADYLIAQGETVFDSDRRDPTPPRVRPELSPPGTHGPGVPRLC